MSDLINITKVVENTVTDRGGTSPSVPIITTQVGFNVETFREKMLNTLDVIIAIRDRVESEIKTVINELKAIKIPWWNIKSKIEAAVKQKLLKDLLDRLYSMLNDMFNVIGEKLVASFPPDTEIPPEFRKGMEFNPDDFSTKGILHILKTTISKRNWNDN